jgi:hypothetical protein
MAEPQEEVQAEKKSIKFMEELMQEVKLMFFVGVACMWASLLLCEWIKQPGAFAVCAAQVSAMYLGIVAKVTFGK